MRHEPSAVVLFLKNRHEVAAGMPVLTLTLIFNTPGNFTPAPHIRNFPVASDLINGLYKSRNGCLGRAGWPPKLIYGGHSDYGGNPVMRDKDRIFREGAADSVSVVG